MSSSRYVPRLYINQPLLEGGSVLLPKAQAHYLQNVMRQKRGGTIKLFNGSNGEWLGRIEFLDRKSATIELIEQTKAQKPEPDIWIAFAPIKFGKIDFLVQKVTELGAAHIMPVQTKHTIVSRIKEERLDANIIEAAEQSERLSLPSIAPYQSFDKLLSEWPQDRTLIYGDETGKGVPPAKLLPEIADKPLGLIIGPEGGFSDLEHEMLKRQSFTASLSLGERILRADTAALAGLTCLMAFTGQWT